MLMAERGARHLVFTSRSGATHPKAAELIENLDKLGVKTKVFACDISNSMELANVLQEIQADGFPAVRGVITLAMQLQVIPSQR